MSNLLNNKISVRTYKNQKASVVQGLKELLLRDRFPRWLSGKESTCLFRRLGQEDPLEEQMATYSSILPGKSHGQRSLVGYSPWHHELDTTEATMHACTGNKRQVS